MNPLKVHHLGPQFFGLASTDEMTEPRIFRFYLLAFAIGIFATGGCDFEGGAEEQVRDQLENARQKWQEQDIQTYQLVYSQQRGDVIVDTAKVFVRSGAVDSTATTPNVSDEELLVGTVESFFDLIESRIGEEGSQYGANFHEEQGFPTSYNADFQDDRRDHDIITIELVE